MEKYFYKNSPQILDFFAALIARNILAGKTTVLVSRKDDKAFCAAEMAKRLKALGITATVPTEGYDSLGKPSPAVVPVIHYGMVGVNTFEAYDACYCLNSYYVPDEVLNTSLMEHEPARYKVPVRTEIGPDGNRRVVVADPAHALSGLDVVGNAHLRKLEVDPAIQAVGRVRFFTKPREVIFFQMHDLQPDVGPVTEWRSLAEARAALGIPKMAELKRAGVVLQLRALVDGGLSIAKAAEKLYIHKETARRWLNHDGPGDFLQLPIPDKEDHPDA